MYLKHNLDHNAYHHWGDDFPFLIFHLPNQMEMHLKRSLQCCCAISLATLYVQTDLGTIIYLLS